MMLTGSEPPPPAPMPFSGACLCPPSSRPQWRGHKAAQVGTEDGMGAGRWVTWLGPLWHPAEPRGGDNSKGAHSTPASLEAGPLTWTPAPC